MACCQIDSCQDGFATPTATMISLALALAAAAVTSASLAQLNLARSDFRRSQIEDALAGAQQHAAMEALGAGPAGPIRWSEAVGDHNVQVLAEPETLKASPTSVALLDDSAFKALDVADPGALKARLKQLTLTQAVGPEIEAADPSLKWRACARALVSPFGLSQELRLYPTRELTPSAPMARTGEVWRVRVTDASGWADDRIVRFTGNVLHPAATVQRRFAKIGREGVRCDSFFNNAG
jgi:hypothetical protein